ncbi:CHAT domain-containing protein [Persicimonas caeni]|uniref:CHAT domain-containing protein n=1 Tax=Persicimonas caeni TaxID=2292766 RepID=A0A4Y6PUQ5_PERCE|nr:CHAT domain-containing protein [Persicimonas caeni]QDG52038.1 CHAT domain-containing protein [Persicimonas caeni]QED33259.1 CHAT domain-containing protein [Persicimonas caeni]
MIEQKRAHRILAAAALLCMLASCAIPQKTADDDHDHDDDHAAASPDLELRDAIDHRGTAADCARYTDATGSEAWLGAWCGLRTHDWPLARRSAMVARTHFEAAGERRRHVEMSLVEAIAAREAGEGDARKAAERAHRWWREAKMPLHGDLSDRHAGDLPYLFAAALERGLLRDETLSRRMLLDIAWGEYRSFRRREALPYVLRARAQVALDAGSIGEAIDHLEEATRLDRRAERAGGLRQDLALFAQLADLLGLGINAGGVVDDATDAAGPSLSELDEKHITRLLQTPAGRRALADTIATLRSAPNLAIQPPPVLVRTLRAHTDFAGWGGDSWRLGYQGGQLLVERGHTEDARRYLDAAVRTIERTRTSLPTPTLRQHFFADKRKVYMALVDTHVGLDTANRVQADYRAGLRLANGLKARGLLDLLDGRIDATLAAEREMDVALDADSLEAGSLNGAADAALSRLTRWQKAAEKTSPSATPFGSLPSAVTSKLDRKTAVLEYLIMPRRSYVWVLTDDGIDMRRIAGREEIEPLVDAFLGTFAHSDDPEAQKRHRKLAERLYVELVGPVEDVIKDVDRLVIAPDEKLYELPFEALAKPTSKAKPRYVVLDRTVSYTPSAAVLARLIEREAPPASQRALVLGAPDLDRPAIDLLALAKDLPASGMFTLSHMFPALPGARAELDSVKKRLGAQSLDVDTLTGNKAAESWLRQTDLARYGLIHLATHGVSDARPLHINQAATLEFRQPALLLSRTDDAPDDGVLTLAELLARKTSAHLVVLSGCTTGRGWRTLGEGAYGLAGAILYTGSHNVIASTWSVTDDGTTRLMSGMYKAIAAGEDPAAALRKSQIEMVQRGTPPSNWAAFRLVGGV